MAEKVAEKQETKLTNLQVVTAVLARHREARQWTDDAVAADLLTQLGLKPDGTADHVTDTYKAAALTDPAAAEEAHREAAEKERQEALREAAMAEARAEAAKHLSVDDNDRKTVEDEEKKRIAAEREETQREEAERVARYRAQAGISAGLANPPGGVREPHQEIQGRRPSREA